MLVNSYFRDYTNTLEHHWTKRIKVKEDDIEKWYFYITKS